VALQHFLARENLTLRMKEKILRDNMADASWGWRRAAVFVDKFLKGAKPADLPVEQPTRFELVLNLKAVKALGLTIPPSLLFQADEVLQ
jgi:putative tryptophan/tyrosine transport system substrate-binding protein